MGGIEYIFLKSGNVSLILLLGKGKLMQKWCDVEVPYILSHLSTKELKRVFGTSPYFILPIIQ